MNHNWKNIFEDLIQTDFSRPLDMDKEDELFNPDNSVVIGLLKIYSMESFVYSTLNTATREHQEDKAETMGPFAQAFRWILTGASMSIFASNRLDNSQLTDL